MKSNAPWSVKGIERDARETAKDAARREGMTVGEWLNQMIYSHGEESASSGEVEGLKLRDIVTAIEHLRARVAEAEKKNTESVSSLSRNVGGVVERLQRLERVKPAEGTYDDLASRIDRLEKNGGDRNRIEALKALEKAVSQVAVQFSTTQKTTLRRLDSAEQQLQEFAERIDRVGTGESEPADMSPLQKAIEGLAERVARAEKVAHEAAALKSAAAQSADPAFVEQTGARLRVLGDEIKRGGDQIRAFEKTIAKLSEQIEAAEQRSSDGVQKVADTIAEVRKQVMDRVEEGEASGETGEAVNETNARLDTLQDSFDQMRERVEALSKARAATPPADEAAPEIDAESDKTADQAASDAEALEYDAEALKEAEAVVENDASPSEPTTTEPEPERDPFAFADEFEIEADDEDAAAPVEDFSFELDEDEDSAPNAAAGAPQAPAENKAGDAQSRLARVRSALTGGGFSRQDGADEAEDDINALLSDLDEENALDDDDDQQSDETASLMPASDVDAHDEADNEADASGAESRDDVVAFEDSEIADERNDRGEDSTSADDDGMDAGQRAEDAAPLTAGGAGRATRRNLTAKQRAILAARARQKRLTAELERAPEPHDGEPITKPSAAAPETDNDEDASPSGRFAKITEAISATRARLSRRKAASDTTPSADAGPLDMGGDEEQQGRNSDRAAFETLQPNASARPITLALGGAIILAIVALGFLVKDFVFKPEDAASPSLTTAQPAAGEAPAAPASQSEALPTVPEAPAIDPTALYEKAMNGLSAASNETAARQAISDLQDAAALGYPPAQLQIGELYKTGQGVEQDLGQARVWFRRAANGGNVLAMHRIGVMTARGDGGPADSSEAIGWFEQAANFGLVDSQYNLGAIYHPSAEGSAIQDAEKAYFWYSLAAQNGDQAAQPLAAGVAAGLTTSERAAADQRVSAWIAQTPNPDANAAGGEAR